MIHIMATETTTIRVPLRTRNLLTIQAADRGISLAAHVTELAERAERDAIFAAEREARRAEANNPAAIEEYQLWESTLEDGID